MSALCLPFSFVVLCPAIVYLLGFKWLLFTCSASSAVVYLFRFKLRCGCHAGLSATVLACQCLNQFMLIDEHIKRMVTNGHTQHRLRWARHGACLFAVECVYCCVLNLNHCVSFVCCVVVSYECIITRSCRFVNPNQGLI